MDRHFSTDHESEALPSVATLERYVGGDMADDERERLEAQIAKDPLLADAVEGLRMSLSDSDFTTRLSRIRSSVAASVEALPPGDSLSSKRKSRVKPFPQYLVYTAVAAGFALLFVFVGLVRNGEEDSPPPDLITQNQIIKPESTPAETAVPQVSESLQGEESGTPTVPQAPPARIAPRAAQSSQPEPILESEGGWGSIDDEEALEGEAAFGEMADSDGIEDDFAPAQNASLGARETTETPAINATAPMNEPAPAAIPPQVQETERQEEELAKLAETAVREETQIIREPTRPASAPISTERTRRNQYAQPQVDFNTEDLPFQDEADQTAGAVSKAQLMADLLTEAIRLHDQKKLDSANLLLDEVLLSEKDNIVASYYKGKSLVAQEKFSEAIPFLLTASDNETSAVFEEARWQLAKAYLGAGKNRKTRSLLKSISESTGKYQVEAAELLQNMD